MQTYLLAADLFVLTALLLGLNNFSRDRHSWRLLPLFLLVISRSLILILFLRTPVYTSIAFIGALEVLSTTCLVWTLINPVISLPGLWKRVFWMGGGIAFFLVFLLLIPDWPVPYQIHSLTIATLGAPLILLTLGQIGWIHLASVFLLAIANFLDLSALTNVSWLVLLGGYGFFIGALHRESIQRYQGRQQASEATAQKALSVSRESRRLLEVSEIISTVPSLDDAIIYLVRSMAHITHSDQAALFMVDIDDTNWAYLAAIYSPERPVDLMQQQRLAVNLINCEPLQAAISKQPQQVIVANQTMFNEFNLRGGNVGPGQHPHIISEEMRLPLTVDPTSLDDLYALWQEERTGPTLIQPLTVQGQSVGALVLGNPVTKRIIRENDQVLCNSLASQMGTIVEAHRRYVELETQVDTLASVEPDVVFDEVLDSAAETTVDDEPQSISTMVSFDTDLSVNSGQYLSILETVDDGVVVSNADGRVKMVNIAAERILGKSRQELIEQPIGTVYGDINSGESIEDLAMAFSRRNQPLPTYYEDDDRAIEGRLIPWRNNNSEWLGIIAVFRDVTPQVKSDKDRNNTITALTRVMRDPLGIIKGYVELMLGGMVGEYSSEQLHVQRIIHSSAEQMTTILDNALQISFQDKREVLPNFEEIDVEQVINRVIHDLTPMIQVSELDLVKEIKTELPLMDADRKHLHRILENLLSNACRFTPPGGQITLRVWAQDEREGNKTNSHLMLMVTDNGVGIPQSELKRVFDPFYQLGNQNPDEKPGLGMGLAVVKKLVEMHNGRVWVESLPGSGSIFQVALPLRQQ